MNLSSYHTLPLFEKTTIRWVQNGIFGATPGIIEGGRDDGPFTDENSQTRIIPAEVLEPLTS